jgi:hypothetical protein
MEKEKAEQTNFILPPPSVRYPIPVLVVHEDHDKLGEFVNRAYMQTIPTVYWGPKKETQE